MGAVTGLCLAGMHRSGTSLVASMLHELGLDLGPPAEIMIPDQNNPEGYWENLRFVEINDSLLAAAGGSWDQPPAWPTDWPGLSGIDEILARADALIGRFGPQPWGWKDPRNSLTLPFWQLVASDLRVIVSVRNPLEVAESLRRRNNLSRAHSLSLWQAHYERLRAAVTPEKRIVVAYETLLSSPAIESARLGGFAGLDPGDEALKRAVSRVHGELRHVSYAVDDVRAAGAPPDVVALYAVLCEEAGMGALIRRTQPG